MLRNHLTVAVRILRRLKGYSLTNIIGLAIGLACCQLIALHVTGEMSFDRFHTNGDRICRVVTSYKYAGGDVEYKAYSGGAPAGILAAECPDIESVVRFYSPRTLVGRGDVRIYEDAFFYADSGALTMFSFPLAEGDPDKALNAPGSVVLTKQAARKYFGDYSPMGQVLTLDNNTDVIVTGVLEDIPANSHLQFDFLASMSTVRSFWPNFENRWDTPFWTYVLLREGSAAASIGPGLTDMIGRRRPVEPGAAVGYHLQPLKQIHLNPMTGEIGVSGDPSRLFLYGGIAALILIVACINFVNLSVAQFARRSVEVGVRKVLGASKGQLMRQFAVESMLLVLIASALSVGLAELLLPVFRQLVGSSTVTHYSGNWLVFGGLAAVAVIAGLAAAIGPALLMSTLRPISAVRLSPVSGGAAVVLRRALVVFQFAVSAALIFCTLVVYGQLDHMRSGNLGYDPENIVVVSFERDMLSSRYELIKDDLAGRSGIRQAAVSSQFPIQESGNALTVRLPGSQGRNMATIWVDDDYADALGLTFIERVFRPNDAADRTSPSFIINEAAAIELGLATAVGNSLQVYADGGDNISFGYEGRLAGIVRDFHYRDLRNRIVPTVMVIDPRQNPPRMRHLLVRLDEDDIAAGLASLREVHDKYAPGRPFEYAFLADRIDGVYRGEQRFFETFGYSCLLAVFTGLIGLFGLALHMTTRRTKEIGIRRVLGASVSRILVILNREFVLLVLAGNVIALPVAYYFLSGWLSRYPYRISLGYGYFVATCAVSAVLALAAVGYQSWRSAMADPVESLKYE